MDLTPNEDQTQIINIVSALLAEHLPPHRLLGGNYRQRDGLPGLWDVFAGSGWLGIAAPEDSGGVGLSVVEEALLFHEMGRALAPTAFLATTQAIHENSDSAEPLITGARRAGFALPYGNQLMLLDADLCDLFLRPGAPGLLEKGKLGDLQPVDCLDSATLALSAAMPADQSVSDTADWHRTIIIAAYLSGMAVTMRDTGVEHANTREQFGRPIGSFQAIKHRCSDMALRCEAARSQTLFAAVVLRDAPAEAALHAAAAFKVAREAALDNARDTMQIHGALGMTDEFSGHLFVKRVHLLDQIEAGTAAARRQALLDAAA